MSPSGHFFPIDEYKDLTLREILDITDDLIFDGNDNIDLLLGQFPLEPALLQAAPEPTFTTSDDAALPATQFQPASIPQQQMEPQMIPSIYQELATPAAAATTTRTPLTPSSSCIDLSPQRKKRSRGSEPDDDDESSEDGVDIKTGRRRFRSYQAGQWSDKFQELCEYRQKMGHCLVSHTFTENLPLARWVKRQRYQYKLMMQKEGGDTSSSGCSAMTPERVQALKEIGFVWDSQGAAWGERLSELNDFCRKFSHCNVPSNFAENPQLATWVKCQRRQYKVYKEGKASNMTSQRVGELESLGFAWELRGYNNNNNKKKARASC